MNLENFPEVFLFIFGNLETINYSKFPLRVVKLHCYNDKKSCYVLLTDKCLVSELQTGFC